MGTDKLTLAQDESCWLGCCVKEAYASLARNAMKMRNEKGGRWSNTVTHTNAESTRFRQYSPQIASLRLLRGTQSEALTPSLLSFIRSALVGLTLMGRLAMSWECPWVRHWSALHDAGKNWVGEYEMSKSGPALRSRANNFKARNQKLDKKRTSRHTMLDVLFASGSGTISRRSSRRVMFDPVQA